MSSSGLNGHQTCMWYIYICVGKTHIYTHVFKKKKVQEGMGHPVNAIPEQVLLSNPQGASQ